MEVLTNELYRPRRFNYYTYYYTRIFWCLRSAFYWILFSLFPDFVRCCFSLRLLDYTFLLLILCHHAASSSPLPTLETNLWLRTTPHHSWCPDCWFVRPLHRARFEIACSNTDFQFFLEIQEADEIPAQALYRLAQVMFDMHFTCVQNHRKCASSICIAGQHNTEQKLNVEHTPFGTYLRHLGIPIGLTLAQWKLRERVNWDNMFAAAGIPQAKPSNPRSHKKGKKLRAFERKVKKDSPYCESHFDRAYHILRHLDPTAHRSAFDVPNAPYGPAGHNPALQMDQDATL